MRKALILTSAILLSSPAALMANVNIDTDLDGKTEIRLDQLDHITDETIAELRELGESMDDFIDNAYGYAVFDTTKAGLIVTGTGGTGVAVNARTGERTYMRVGGGGLALGGGAQQFKLVMLFETQDDFQEFVNGDWNGNVSAQAVAGEAGANVTADFEDGVAAFQFQQKGLMAQTDISGLKFWVADTLNTDS